MAGWQERHYTHKCFRDQYYLYLSHIERERSDNWHIREQNRFLPRSYPSSEIDWSSWGKLISTGKSSGLSDRLLDGNRPNQNHFIFSYPPLFPFINE